MNNATLCALVFSSATLFAKAQAINETVSLGASYANETWYQLSSGTETSAAKSEWDLAFAADGFSSAIRINGATGTQLWSYQNGTNADWSSVDTAGLSTWTPLYNSSEDWNIGAFDQNVNTTNPMDFGWGVYNVTTHFVTGDSLFIIQLSNGDFKKLDIINLANGAYNFRYSNLDNSDEVTRAFTKSDYTGKLFGYYSIIDDAFLDREPALDSWDLVFKQYIDFVPTPYGVTGILSNPNWVVAEANGVSDPSTYVDFGSQTFEDVINVIGYDWKTFNMSTFVYDISDDVVFFMQNEGGDIWKIIPTGFGGSTTGDVDFTKEQLTFAGIAKNGDNQLVEIYPNPASDRITITFDSKASTTQVIVRNTNGQTVVTEEFSSSSGLTQKQLDIASLNKGLYFVEIVQNGLSTTKSIIKQ